MKWNELWLSMIDRSQRKLKSHGAASRGIPGYLGFIPGKAGMGDMGEHKPCGHMWKRAELLNYIGKLVEMYRRTCVFNVKMRWENSFDVFSSTVSKSMKTLYKPFMVCCRYLRITLQRLGLKLRTCGMPMSKHIQGWRIMMVMQLGL